MSDDADRGQRAAGVDGLLAALAANPYNAVIELAPRQSVHTATAAGSGPLGGMPVAVKDLIDVAGLPTRCGSTILDEAAPADADAAVVAGLRSAGAVVVAKSHTHEFAYGPTGDVAARGPCRNPHDPERIPGGSSSGSAALVAAGLVPLALGTDTGCSIRTPAALCGVVGLKPALGTLPTTGVFPLSETCDHVGLLGADVSTVALAFGALTGRRVDPSIPVRDMVIGRPRDSYWQVHDPEIAAAVDRAAAALAAAGATFRDVWLPGIDELAATYPVIVGCEAYATHASWLADRPEDYQPATAARLHQAGQYTGADYVAAQRTRRRLGDELTARLTDAGIDLLLLATTPLRATPIGAEDVEAPDGTPVAVRPALLSLTLPFNLLGWPAVSVPGPHVPGLPAGVQLAALRGGEPAVLAAAARVASG